MKRRRIRRMVRVGVVSPTERRKRAEYRRKNRIRLQKKARDYYRKNKGRIKQRRKLQQKLPGPKRQPNVKYKYIT